MKSVVIRAVLVALFAYTPILLATDDEEDEGFTFEEKLNVALNVPGLRDVYAEDIIRDEETGKITTSRCMIFIRDIDLQDIHQQIDMLRDTRAATMRQPINQLPENRDELPFFA